MTVETMKTLEEILCSGYISDDNYLILDVLSKKTKEQLSTKDRSELLNLISEQIQNGIPLKNFKGDKEENEDE